jgi:hypothetical protein
MDRIAVQCIDGAISSSLIRIIRCPQLGATIE